MSQIYTLHKFTVKYQKNTKLDRTGEIIMGRDRGLSCQSTTNDVSPFRTLVIYYVSPLHVTLDVSRDTISRSKFIECMTTDHMIHCRNNGKIICRYAVSYSDCKSTRTVYQMAIQRCRYTVRDDIQCDYRFRHLCYGDIESIRY